MIKNVNSQSLSFQQACEIVDDYAVRYRNRWKPVIVGISIAIGVISGIAVMAFSLYKVINLPKYPVETRLTDGNGSTETIYTHSGLSFAIWFSSSLVSPFTIGPLTGYLTYTFGNYLLSNKIETFVKQSQYFQSTYESNSTVNLKEIACLLNLVDDQAIGDLMAKMDFRQLTEARKHVSHRKFTQIVNQTILESHQHWKQILELPSKCQSPKDLEQYLISAGVSRLMHRKTEVLDGIRELYHGKTEMLAVIDRQRFGIKKAMKHPQKLLRIDLKDETTLVDQTWLAHQYGYFFRATEGKKKSVLDLKEWSYDEYSLYEDALYGWIPNGSFEKWIQLIKMADFLQHHEMLRGIESLLIANSMEFSEEQQFTLFVQFPQLQGFKDHLEQQFLNLRCNLENWEELWDIAKEFEFFELKRGLKEHAEKELQEAVNQGYPPNADRAFYWLKRCVVACDSDEEHKKLLEKLPDYSVNNIRLQLEIAQIWKRDGVEKYFQGCLTFIGENTDAVKDLMPWMLEKCPKEVAEILYPPPPQNREGWVYPESGS